MEYIRSTSNIEGIHICKTNDVVEISKFNEKHTMPLVIFINVIRKYILDDGKKEDYAYQSSTLKFKIVEGKPLWHLSYANWKVTFTDVVLEAIIHNQPWDFCNKKEYDKFRNFHLFESSRWTKKSKDLGDSTNDFCSA